MKLKNGSEVPDVLVTLVMMHLRDLLDRADFNHPEHKGEGSLGLGYLLALYDLSELCKSEAYSPNCFGRNRQKLLDRKLVEGDTTGPLYVRPEIRAIVQSALVYDPVTTVLRLESPV